MSMIFDKISDVTFDKVFFRLGGLLPHVEVLLKLEGFNRAGSIKLKTAIGLINQLEQSGRLKQGGRVIESSSGNLGIALSLLCAERGYGFVCVTDPNALEGNLALIRAYGGEVVMITERDMNGGYLGSRIAYIRQRLADDKHLVWPNQYANVANKWVHRDWTAKAVLEAVPDLDYLFVGVGTSGTLMGCIERFCCDAPHVKIFGVDVKGSVTFQGPPGPRHIPGIGTSSPPDIFDPKAPFEQVVVTEAETISMNRDLLRRWTLLSGGSTGSVLAGLLKCADRLRPKSKVVAISPDFGDRYIDTVYSDAWMLARFPALATIAKTTAVETTIGV